MKSVIVYLSLLLTLTLISCVLNISPNVQMNKVLLKFDVSSLVGKAVGDLYVTYMKLSNGEKGHFKIETSEATILLDPDEIYVIGVAKETENGIKILGFLGDANNDLACIPISESASGVIDLGTVYIEDENGEKILQIDVSSDEFVDMVGFDENTLRNLGKVDITFKNMLNPDIDGNGVFDTEEGLNWGLVSGYLFNYYGDEPRFVRQSLIMNVPKSYFEKFGDEPVMDCLDMDCVCATLTNLSEGVVMSTTKETKTGRVPIYQWYFHLDEDDPREGDLLIEVDNRDFSKTYEFYLENMRFFNPLSDFDAFIFPKFEVRAYSDGKVKEISWEWFMKDSSGISPASSEIVYLISDKNLGPTWIYFSNKEWFKDFTGGEWDKFILFEPSRHGLDAYSSQRVNVEDGSYGGPYWVYPTWVDMFQANFREIALSDLGFLYLYDYEELPSVFSEDDPIIPMNEENLEGYWYNLYYHSQNLEVDSDSNLSFSPKIVAALTISPDGTFVAHYLFGNREDLPKAFEGTYKILNSTNLELDLNNGEKIYLYVEMHEKYMEAMIYTDENNPPGSIDRSSENYRIYTKIDSL